MDKLEKLRIFITWSGEQSRLVAEALRGWLPNVFQFVDPFMSTHDVHKGAKWREVIGGELQKTDFGIICLTADNLTAPWILFEAGALSKSADSAVWTYLFNLDNTDVEDPLAQFQHTLSTEGDTKKLVKAINDALGGNQLSPERVEKTFERWWPDLEKQFKLISIAPEKGIPKRSQEEKIDEILTLVRELNVREQDAATTRVRAIQRALGSRPSRDITYGVNLLNRDAKAAIEKSYLDPSKPPDSG